MRLAPSATLVALALPWVATPALAQPYQGEAAAGRPLAETWCANCHLIAPGGPGPASDAAPAFAAIAARPEVTAEGVQTFLRVPHANMPDHRLTLHQVQDLAAFLLAQRR